MISGTHLKIARLIYGFATQKDLADELDVSLATVQRYEDAHDVDAKTRGRYEHELGFDLEGIVSSIARFNRERERFKDRKRLEFIQRIQSRRK